MIFKNWLSHCNEWAWITFKNPVIAGGAVRDTKLGKPVKDVDIWVRSDDPGLLPFGEYKRNQRSVYIPCAEERGLLRVIKTTWAGDAIISPVDIIVMSAEVYPEWPSALIKTFDFYICQAWLDRHGRIQTTPEFDQDHRDNIIRINYLPGYRVTRVTRMLKKFPNYTFIPHPDQEQWLT